MKPDSLVERVVRDGLCAGCGACAHLAPQRIAMVQSEDGFLRPVVSGQTTAEEQAAIAAACPGVGLSQSAEGRPDDVLWGPITKVRTGYANDDYLRWRASSGGVLSALLVYLLESNTVDRIAQTTASLRAPFANETTISVTAAEVVHAAGSRYAPSAPLADLDAILSPEGRAAFVGKPCDVAALRALARFDSRIDEKIPYMLSFFCAGVPSHTGAHKILEAMKIPEDKLGIFRYRGHGWPGQATAVTKDGRSETLSYHESWGGILSKHLQFRCKICPDGTGGLADVVCADAWHCDDQGYPLFEERDGVSLVVSRNAKGEELVRTAMASHAISAEPLAASAITAMQPGQVRRKRFALARLTAFWLVRGYRPKFTGFNLAAAARSAGVLRNARDFLGTLRRLLRQQRTARRSPQ